MFHLHSSVVHRQRPVLLSGRFLGPVVDLQVVVFSLNPERPSLRIVLFCFHLAFSWLLAVDCDLSSCHEVSVGCNVMPNLQMNEVRRKFF